MTALCVFVALSAILALAYLTAPEGYPVRADATGASAHGANGQDETGFHFGRVSVDLLSKSRTSATSAARAAEDGKQPRP